jgi:lipopolysaccharide transport system ATP-binding protein
MADTVIVVEDLHKRYRLGTVGSSTLRDDLEHLWQRLIGRKSNDYDSEKYHDALKGVSFTVKRGEVVGLIGKNGAGKSTLLKILSKVTAPTKGTVKIKGRLASLLEVGTGFHPELTGLENIYLNGAILGMTRQEIRKKQDEIIEFAGIEKYINTPVKRYSSGMYVRLAFAVAAHLEPDILVVDEVLAVGDIEFQKKCLGKMGEVSQKEGRTILFVSHNMQAIKRLCNRCIFLEKGIIKNDGNAQNVIDSYLNSFINDDLQGINGSDSDKNIVIDKGCFQDIKIFLYNDYESKTNTFYFSEPIKIEISFLCLKELKDISFIFYISGSDGTPVSIIASDSKNVILDFKKKKYELHFLIENNLLTGSYFLTLMIIYNRNGEAIYWSENILNFNIESFPRFIEREYVLRWTNYGHVLGKIIDFKIIDYENSADR